MNHNNSQAKSRRFGKRWWLTFGVIAGLAIGVGLRFWLAEPAHEVTTAIPSRSKAAEVSPVRLRAWEKVEPRVKQAEQTGANAVEKHLQCIDAFIAERRQGVVAFAEDTLSLSGKWAFVRGKLAGDGGKRHAEFLRECFGEHLFREDELRAVVQSAVAGYVSEARGLESALLVQLKADLADSELYRGGGMPELKTDAEFRRAYEGMAKAVLPIVARDLGVTVSREVVAFVGSEIAAQVAVRTAAAIATRLGISGGILGTGAAAGVATFGVGLGISFVADLALDQLMKKGFGYDPVGDIAAKADEALNRVRTSLVEGLRYEIRKIHEVQSRVRRESLRKLILEGGES